MTERIGQTSLFETFYDWPPEISCLGCGHYRPLHNDGSGRIRGYVCHYLLDVGHSRGCPFGPGCPHHPAASR